MCMQFYDKFFAWQDQVNCRVSVLSIPLEKLKKVHVSISVFGEKDLYLVACVLKNSPLLETMAVSLPSSFKICYTARCDLILMDKLLCLERSSSEATIIIRYRNI